MSDFLNVALGSLPRRPIPGRFRWPLSLEARSRGTPRPLHRRRNIAMNRNFKLSGRTFWIRAGIPRRRLWRPQFCDYIIAGELSQRHSPERHATSVSRSRARAWQALSASFISLGSRMLVQALAVSHA